MYYEDRYGCRYGEAEAEVINAHTTARIEARAEARRAEAEREEVLCRLRATEREVEELKAKMKK